ncbi:protein fuzzy homolog isoform X5 [Narcine bancroftii]|uniref:protein fuzzy homolog isoform X5 n=1 Tax=Narcine bancroftii TaxID=1343680 RepID=UPI00383195CD
MAGGLQLLCLSTSSGVPLYCRSKGESRQLSFSVIGSLNGVHMFGSNQDVLLTSTSTDNCRVCWRVFHDSITLIVMSSEEDASDLYFGRLLENVFNAMVLVIGLDDLVNLKNVERLKRELRACYKLIDSLLAASDWIGDLTMCVDCVASPDAAVLQEALDVFVAAAESNFGCLMVMGKTVVATEKWWRLTTQELVLLALLVGSLAPNSSRDYPIYLPHGSPTLVERFWSPVLECLKTCLRVHQRSFLASINLHHSIVGLLLINREQNKNIFTLQPHADESSQQQGAVLLPERRRSVLRQFYTLAVSAYFPADTSEDQPDLQPSRRPFWPMSLCCPIYQQSPHVFGRWEETRASRKTHAGLERTYKLLVDSVGSEPRSLALRHYLLH